MTDCVDWAAESVCLNCNSIEKKALGTRAVTASQFLSLTTNTLFLLSELKLDLIFPPTEATDRRNIWSPT